MVTGDDVPALRVCEQWDIVLSGKLVGGAKGGWAGRRSQKGTKVMDIRHWRGQLGGHG